LLHSNRSTPAGERNCSVAAPATAIEYAAHSIAAFGTAPAEAPPQLLIDLLEWHHQFCKSLPIPVQHQGTEFEFTVVQKIHIAASVPIAIGTAVIIYRGLSLPACRQVWFFLR